MLKLLRHMRLPEWLMALASVILIGAQVQLDLKLPDYMSEITVLVQTEGSLMSAVLKAGGKMLGCAALSLILAVISGYFCARIAAGFTMRLREMIYCKVMSFSNEEIGNFSTASLITRSTNDITQIQMFVAMGLMVIVRAPIMGIMAINKISTKSLEWSVLTGAVILFIVVMIVFIMTYAMPRFKRIQKLTDNLNRVTRENLSGLLVVRAYNAEDYQEKKFGAANSELTKTNLQANTAMSVMQPGMNIAMNALTLGIYWIGAVLINNVAPVSPENMAQRLSLFSDMVVFTSYAMQVVMAFVMLVMIFIMLPRASVSARRLNEVLDTEVKMKEGSRTDGAEGLHGQIEFKNVSFAYPGSGGEVIHDISFKAEPGETVAIIGATGCGKSTVVNLIPRMYDPTKGQVLVDGVDVKDYTREALGSKIGFVSQKAFLFSGTVEGNIGYGVPGISDSDVRKAAGVAQAAEFIEIEDCGYDGDVAQGGSNFSGGQKQRLSIARAVAKKPEIYVFDDSFSALDYKTDRALRRALREESAGATCVIVAQRIGTIRDADRILVIDNGRIVGSGTHSQLMESCDVYREIAYSQLSKEEL